MVINYIQWTFWTIFYFCKKSDFIYSGINLSPQIFMKLPQVNTIEKVICHAHNCKFMKQLIEQAQAYIRFKNVCWQGALVIHYYNHLVLRRTKYAWIYDAICRFLMFIRHCHLILKLYIKEELKLYNSPNFKEFL